MKKSIILLIISIVALCIPLQAQHMKFMGIPLTGTITQFQSKLTAKGVKYDKVLSRELSAGTRVFDGVFAGEKAKIYVYYDPSSKIVYRAKAVVTCETMSICESKYQEFKSLLSTKYNCYEEESEYDGHECNTYMITKENPTSMDDIIGGITLYVSTSEFIYPIEHYLHIDYNDYKNSIKSEVVKMDDL